MKLTVTQLKDSFLFMTLTFADPHYISNFFSYLKIYSSWNNKQI